MNRDFKGGGIAQGVCARCRFCPACRNRIGRYCGEFPEAYSQNDRLITHCASTVPVEADYQGLTEDGLVRFDYTRSGLGAPKQERERAQYRRFSKCEGCDGRHGGACPRPVLPTALNRDANMSDDANRINMFQCDLPRRSTPQGSGATSRPVGRLRPLQESIPDGTIYHPTAGPLRPVLATEFRRATRSSTPPPRALRSPTPAVDLQQPHQLTPDNVSIALSNSSAA